LYKKEKMWETLEQICHNIVQTERFFFASDRCQRLVQQRTCETASIAIRPRIFVCVNSVGQFLR